MRATPFLPKVDRLLLDPDAELPSGLLLLIGEFPKIRGTFRVPLKGYYKGTLGVPLKGSTRVLEFPKIRGYRILGSLYNRDPTI